MHRTYPKHIFFLDELHRVLKSNGLVFIRTPNWHYNYKSFFNDATHYIPFTPERLESALNICGFDDIQTCPGLRLEPAIQYTNRFRFFLSACLPFRGDSIFRIVVPFLCGRATSVIAIATKRDTPANQICHLLFIG